MLFSSALSLVGFCYSLVIMCLYFWKKKTKSERKLTTLFFTISVVFLVFLGILEFVCLHSIINIDKHPVFTEVICRLHILADIVWTSIVLVYIYSATINETVITNYTKVRRILGVGLIVFDALLYIFTFWIIRAGNKFTKATFSNNKISTTFRTLFSCLFRFNLFHTIICFF